MMKECPVDFAESRTVTVTPAVLRALINHYVMDAQDNNAYCSAAFSLTMLHVLAVLTDDEYERLDRAVEELYHFRIQDSNEEVDSCVRNPVE